MQRAESLKEEKEYIKQVYNSELHNITMYNGGRTTTFAMKDTKGLP